MNVLICIYVKKLLLFDRKTHHDVKTQQSFDMNVLR